MATRTTNPVTNLSQGCTPNPSQTFGQGSTTRRTPSTRAGATLGYVPDRPAKSLVAAGLAAQGFEAQFIIEGPDGPFRVVSAHAEPDQDIVAARAFISGLLFGLRPPAPLAAVVRTHKSEWARFTSTGGKLIAGWSASCGSPGCIVVASVRVAHQALAVEQIVTLGWRNVDQGWLCPTCAGNQ